MSDQKFNTSQQSQTEMHPVDPYEDWTRYSDNDLPV